MKTTDGMSAEKVLASGADEDAEAPRSYKDSNSFNPFAVGNADGIRDLLVSQLGEQQSDEFSTCQGDATLYWRIDPVTLA